MTPEEADTRLLVHVIDLLSTGCSTYLVHTVDTNVFVILVGKFNYLLRLNVSAKIWVAFGTGKNYKYLNINSICHALGEQKIFDLTYIISQFYRLRYDLSFLG